MHPLRKRKIRSDGACSQYGTEEDEGSTSEPRSRAGPANRIDEKEQSIVISDSDSMELEEEGNSQKKKALHRKTLSVKRKIARMTEEEQLALAVKISQQEQANHVKHRQEEEEELLRKAIEESLHSCKSPNRSPIVTVHDLRKEASSGEDDMALDEPDNEHLSQHSQILGQDSPQNPKVLLKRLSQDIVESTSVILSPNCKDPLPCTESCKASSLSPSRIDCAYMSPSTAPLSPVFPVKSPYARKMLRCRLFQDRSPSAVKLPDETEGHSLHCSEGTQLDSSSLISASNKSELTEGTSSLQSASVCLQGSGIGNTSVNNKDAFSKHPCQSSAKKQQNDSTVHYYWGIPFCPNGVDPNAYTQVILCQLEVYEKSLKKSQLQLLKKTEYGEPIDLAASSESSDHTKDNQGSLSQEDTEEIIEGGDKQKPQQSEMEPSEETDSSDIQPGPSKRSKASCSHFQEDDHSCQSEGQVKSQSHEPCTEMLPSECEGVAPEVLVESPILPSDVREENGVNSEMPIENTQEESVCPETQLGSEIQDNDQENQPDLTDPESSQACCLNPPPPELMACGEPVLSLDVECPMCGCRFSQTQIERHAAYCDGTKDEPQMTVLRPRNRPPRHVYNGSHDSAASSDSGRLEKCYLCKSLVPIKDYQTHVDKCLQSAAQETQGTQMLKGSKETEREGRLLTMLEQSESILTDENNSALDFSGMSPPREEQAGSFSSSHLSISDSPIRSFVSISEIKDCLVDFKKQLSRPPKHQPNKKRPQHRGKRRRM
ncbi:BRCA1-A complex subunit RAP80 isoform X1 [Aquarana catesbeiana]|uniref:BRCA1-A complex subunit RAP80 isoform X1 n=1 Tax=Aquarana catesbeiana TaxID=8400 RepID=UPI003CC956F0